MIDYSKLSDKEINTLVAMTMGEKIGKPKNGRQLIAIDGEYLCASFDPCNNPSDAWPIIVEKEISIVFDADFFADPPCQWCKTSTPCGEEYYGDRDKPLRTAMIVFLMMQDAQP